MPPSGRDHDHLEVEWDPGKADEVEAKHGVTFGEAATILQDPLAMTVSDPQHSVGERRFATIGLTQLGNLVVLVHTSRGRRIRLITARRATPAEIRAYEQGKGSRP